MNVEATSSRPEFIPWLNQQASHSYSIKSLANLPQDSMLNGVGIQLTPRFSEYLG